MFEAAIPPGGMTNEWRFVHNIAINEGYYFPPFYRNSYGPCSFFRENYYILGPNGDLFNCVSGVGLDKYKSGTVNDSLLALDIQLSQFLEEDLRDEKCWQCNLLPLCNGGCFYKAAIQGEKICYSKEFEENDIPLLEQCLVQYY